MTSAVSALLLSAVAVLPEGGTNLSFRSWNDSMPRVEDYIFRPQVTDFTPYGRCVLDYVYYGEDGESIHLYFAGDTEIFGKTDVLAGRRVLKAGQDRWVFNVSKWPSCTDPKHVTRIRLGKDHSQGARILLKSITLVEKGAPLPPIPAMSKDEKLQLEKYLAGREERRLAGYRRERELFTSMCRSAGMDASVFAAGIADSMTRVRPRDGFNASCLKPAVSASVRLARGEHEAFQLVIMPTQAEAVDMTVACEGVADGLTVKCSPMGYVRTVAQPANAMGCRREGRHGACPAGIGWWPDPILSYTNGCRIASGDVQSFWIDISASRELEAGAYSFTLKAGTLKVPVTVRVDGFTLPKTTPLPLLVTFNPRARLKTIGKEEYDKRYADPESPVNIWKKRVDEWADFLADRYITIDQMYTRSLPFKEQLKRLRDQGRLGAFTLGYWNPMFASEKYWRGRHDKEFRCAYEFCKKEGILAHAWLYGADEVPKSGLAGVERAAAALRRDFPEVGVMTTALDHTFGGEAPNVTAFCPTTAKYEEYLDQVAKARAAGRQVWWYFCEQPRAPYPNMFVECPPIEARLMMGAMTAKYRPDGCLYYEIAYWNSPRPITGGPFTEWTPVTLPRLHGDGSWVCCGPGGQPLSTQRFENFRDGLDDYACVKILEARQRCTVEIPKGLVDTLKNYTDSPETVRRWRESVYDRIAALPDREIVQ